MELTDTQFARYARHLILDEVGEEGQERLLDSRVLLIGAGGLGAPMILYLAAAGVGAIGVVDDDLVDLTNLQRQVVHVTARVGEAKVASAAAAVASLNPDVEFIAHNTRLTAANAAELIEGYDLVADGSDNFATRYAVNDACYLADKPLVTAALLRFEGQLFTFKRTAPQNAMLSLRIPRAAERGLGAALRTGRHIGGAGRRHGLAPGDGSVEGAVGPGRQHGRSDADL